MKNKIQKGEVVKVTVEKIVPEGLALSRVIDSEEHDGMIVFVRGAYPGETALCEVVERKKTFYKANAQEILSGHHSMRKEAECPHYGLCGGCAMLDIEYKERLKFKVDILKDALKRTGGIDLDTVQFNDIVESPKKFRHRNKMEFAFGESDDGSVILGLRPPGDYNTVIKATDCLLLPELSNKFMDNILEKINNTNLKAYNDRNKSGDIRYLTLRFNHKMEFSAFITVSGHSEKVENTIYEIFDKLRSEFDGLFGCGIFINERVGGVAQGITKTMFGEEYLNQKSGEVTFEVSPESFFQTNIYCTPLLVDQVEKHTGTGNVLWDLFSGIGTLSLPLAHKFNNVYGIEIVEEAVDNAHENAKRNNITNAHYIAGSLKKTLKELLEIEGSYPDALVFDPPRSGIGGKTVGKIMRLPASPRIIYVSCNPVSMSSDISYMLDKYKLVSVTPVDMFPHSYHLETIAVLEPLD